MRNGRDSPPTREAVMSTRRFYRGPRNIAYKEIAKSLCSRHNVVT